MFRLGVSDPSDGGMNPFDSDWVIPAIRVILTLDAAATVGPDLRAGRSVNATANGPPGGRALPSEKSKSQVRLVAPLNVKARSKGACLTRVAHDRGNAAEGGRGPRGRLKGDPCVTTFWLRRVPHGQIRTSAYWLRIFPADLFACSSVAERVWAAAALGSCTFVRELSCLPGSSTYGRESVPETGRDSDSALS